jgi:hypothetical protein
MARGDKPKKEKKKQSKKKQTSIRPLTRSDFQLDTL